MQVEGRALAGLRVRTAAWWQPIVLGESPSRTSDPLQALVGGRSGLFLAQLAGLEPHQLGFLFRLANLLPTLPAEHRKDALLRAAGARLAPDLVGRRVFVLGRRVARGLGVAGEFLAWSPGLWTP